VIVPTEPVTIRVRPKAGSILDFDPDSEGEQIDLRDLHTVASIGDGPSGPGTWWLVAVALGLPLAWLASRIAVRRRGDPASPAARRRRRARRVLARGLAGVRSASDQATLLARFLAARCGEPPSAWIGRDPHDWAEAAREEGARVPEDGLVAELAELQGSLDRRAWAEGDEPLDPARILSFADRWRRGDRR